MRVELEPREEASMSSALVISRGWSKYYWTVPCNCTGWVVCILFRAILFRAILFLRNTWLYSWYFSKILLTQEQGGARHWQPRDVWNDPCHLYRSYSNKHSLGKIEVFRASRVLQHVSSRTSNVSLFCLKGYWRHYKDTLIGWAFFKKICEPYSSGSEVWPHDAQNMYSNVDHYDHNHLYKKVR